MIFDCSSLSPPRVFALPPGRPFFDDLVRTLLKDFGDDLAALAGVRIFVPSRRAVRALREAFSRQAPRGVMLLPRIAATADLSEDDPFIVTSGVAVNAKKAPLAAVKRLKIAGIYHDAMAEAGQPLTWYGALRGASELARTSDLLTEYGAGQEELAALRLSEILDSGAEHWREVSSLLALITERYPEWLHTEGAVDPRQRRAELLRQLSDALAADSSAPLILAAGFLGTSPSSQEFLRRIAEMPNGGVLLPALDFDMSEAAWHKIEAPHPQASYKELFEECFAQFSRKDVIALPYKEGKGASARRALLSMALTPAEATDDWASSLSTFEAEGQAIRALDGLQIAIARTSEEEADFVALALREVLETPDRTAAFVTADRDLARRVAAKLRGWGIEIDDSGGAPIRGSYRATFLRLIAQVMADPSDPAALSGLVHHQLFGIGLAADERRPLVQAFDRFLRGRRPRAGWDGLARSLDDAWRPYGPEGNEADRVRAGDLVLRLRKVFREHLPHDTRAASELLRAHLTIAERLASTDEEPGAERLYRFEDGEVLQPHLDSLLQNEELLGETEITDYPKVFDSLLEGPAFRPPGGQHPRLALYGILEARLQHADQFVVGGLQEGIWPSDAAVDPFLSRSMRKALGLPSPDTDIGRVAHDFLDFASKPHVLLTRSARRGASPARASRLMLRLESFLQKLDPERHTDISNQLRSWRKARFSGTGMVKPASPPRPAPPRSAKPKTLTVSDIALWLRDPYAVFGKRILRLKPMRPYDEAFGPSHRGDMVHKWLEMFGRLQLDDPSDDIERALTELLPDALDGADMPLTQRHLNARFLLNAQDAFLSFEYDARGVSKPIALEARGVIELSVGGQGLKLTGIADRIDRMQSGLLHIIDYKLGGATSVQQGQAFSPQLFLLTKMMEEGGFEGVSATAVEQISYLPLNKRHALFGAKESSQRHLRGAALREALGAQQDRFKAWLEEQYRDQATFPSQIHPYRIDSVGDFDDLARRSEWQTESSDD